MTPREQTNREIVGKFWYSFANKNEPAILQLVTDDCIFKIGVGKSEGVVPYHGTFAGIDKIREYLCKAWGGRLRPECDVVILTGEHRLLPISKDPEPAGLIVHGHVVVGLANIIELFPDRTPMDESEIVMVFRVNEDQNKIFSFQFFTDTAASLLAHLNRGVGQLTMPARGSP